MSVLRSLVLIRDGAGVARPVQAYATTAKNERNATPQGAGFALNRLQTPALFCGRVLFLLSFNVRLQVSFLLSFFVAQGVDALPCSLPLVR